MHTPLVLDITDKTEKGKALHETIEDMVHSTQLYMERPLPDVLKLTQKQLLDLSKLHGHTGQMFDSDVEFYITKYNVMELQVENEQS